MADRGYDRVYREVTLVDGTGGPRRVADVAVAGDTVAAIADAGSLSGGNEVAGSGLVLAPGFIDIHSHADARLLVDGRSHSCVTQGITTIVPGNCGSGVVPSQPGEAGPSREGTIFGSSLAGVTTFPAYLEALRARGVGVNVVPLVPHGMLRSFVAGMETRELTATEIASLTSLVDEAMDAGAAGLSSGLEYSPGIAATTEELAAVAGPVGRRGGFYATHCRNRGQFIVEAALEGVRIAEESGSRLQMSHFIRRPTEPDTSLARRAMDVLHAADRRGVTTRYDVFPFEYGPSPVTMFVPQKFRAEAGSRFAEMLADPRFVRRVIADLDARFIAMLEQGIAADMYVSDDGGVNRYIGKTLGAIAEAKGVPVAEAAIGLLVEAGDQFSAVMINERWADWTDLRAAMADPNFILMGDGSMANLDGPLAAKGMALSDWGYATATLGRFVRELGVLGLEDAVRRLSSAPAEQIGLASRGVVRAGAAADLVLFDPATVGSGVTPANIPVVSTGIVEVMVNGVLVVHAGKVTDALPGRVGLFDVATAPGMAPLDGPGSRR